MGKKHRFKQEQNISAKCNIWSLSGSSFKQTVKKNYFYEVYEVIRKLNTT